MQTVDVQFVRFWKGFDNHCYAFLDLFQKRYHQRLVSSNPDIVFVADRITNQPSPYDPRQYANSVKVFYTGENTRPDPTFDFSFSYDDTTETNFQLPDFALTRYYFDFIKQTEPSRIQHQQKDRFCNFIYRNAKAKERIKFCMKLAQYKFIDRPGKVLNNMANFTKKGRKSDDWWGDKIKHLGEYKFTIAFENQSAPNYVTEKIFDPFYVGSIPIYWGAPNITEYFNPNSFINVQDYNSYEDVVKAVKRIDNSEELYQQMQSAPPIHERSRLRHCTEEALFARFDTIVNQAHNRKNQ